MLKSIQIFFSDIKKQDVSFNLSVLTVWWNWESEKYVFFLRNGLCFTFVHSRYFCLSYLVTVSYDF